MYKIKNILLSGVAAIMMAAGTEAQTAYYEPSPSNSSATFLSKDTNDFTNMYDIRLTLDLALISVPKTFENSTSFSRRSIAKDSSKYTMLNGWIDVDLGVYELITGIRTYDDTAGNSVKSYAYLLDKENKLADPDRREVDKEFNGEKRISFLECLIFSYDKENKGRDSVYNTHTQKSYPITRNTVDALTGFVNVARNPVSQTVEIFHDTTQFSIPVDVAPDSVKTDNGYTKVHRIHAWLYKKQDDKIIPMIERVEEITVYVDEKGIPLKANIKTTFPLIKIEAKLSGAR